MEEGRRSHNLSLGLGDNYPDTGGDAISGTGSVVLLAASEETLIERVSRADRPRVNSDTDLPGDIRRMWSEHGHIYRSSADHIVSTDGRTLEQEVADLMRVIRVTEGLQR